VVVEVAETPLIADHLAVPVAVPVFMEPVLAELVEVVLQVHQEPGGPAGLPERAALRARLEDYTEAALQLSQVLVVEELYVLFGVLAEHFLQLTQEHYNDSTIQL
jgi:hypothetical protein